MQDVNSAEYSDVAFPKDDRSDVGEGITDVAAEDSGEVGPESLASTPGKEFSITLSSRPIANSERDSEHNGIWWSSRFPFFSIAPKLRRLRTTIFLQLAANSTVVDILNPSFVSIQIHGIVRSFIITAKSYAVLESAQCITVITKF